MRLTKVVLQISGKTDYLTHDTGITVIRMKADKTVPLH